MLPRVLDLGRFQTADEKRWLANTTAFVNNIAHADFKHLMLQPHPGITTQWFAAPTIFADNWNIKKLSLALTTAALVIITGYIFFLLWGRIGGILVTLILATNTLLVAHSRILAMDALLAHFLLLSLALLLLWKKTNSSRYLAAAGAAASLAILSKLPGVIIIPFSFAILLPKHYKPIGIWLLGLLITTALVFPSIYVNTDQVFSDVTAFFQSENYTEEHPAGNLYYLRTIIFFSTPLHFFELLIIGYSWRKITPARRRDLATLLFFALIFICMMSLGAKKGDRYILPVFLILDVMAAYAFIIASSGRFARSATSKSAIIIAMLVTWQAFETARLHPYALSYVNPIVKPFFKDRRLGWGEGLDLAAAYLNKNPNAKELTVASFYPSEFATHFAGNSVPLNQHDHASVDYVVLYRAMLERGQAWETDVLVAYQTIQPEKTIDLNGMPYVWIVRRK